MKRAVVLMTILVLGAGGAVLAQEQAGTGKNEPSADVIFDNIIQTLPSQARSQIDSAAASSQTTTNPEVTVQKGAHRGSAEKAAAAKSEALEKLPESVQKRVEQAIQEIEQTKSQRTVQFKEHRQRTKGK